MSFTLKTRFYIRLNKAHMGREQWNLNVSKKFFGRSSYIFRPYIKNSSIMLLPTCSQLRSWLPAILLICIFFSSIKSFAQSFDPASYAKYISSSEAEKHLNLLKAKNQGNSLRSYLSNLGDVLEVDSQIVDVVRISPGKVALKAGQKTFKFLEDFVCLTNKSIDEVKMPVTYIELGSFVEKDLADHVAGKAVLLNIDIMNDLSNTGDFNTILQVKVFTKFLRTRAKAIFFFTKDPSLIKLYADGFLHYNEVEEDNIRKAEKMASETIVSERVASAIMGVSIHDLKQLKTFTKGEVTYKNATQLKTTSHLNISGLIRGRNPKEKSLVFLARYDSVKYDHTFKAAYTGEDQGADANWSGAVSAMQIAKAFASAAKKGAQPYRNVLFLFYTGGVNGIRGLNRYRSNPVVEVPNSIVINLDMIGRRECNVSDDTTYAFLITPRPVNPEGQKLIQEIIKDSKTLKIVTSLENGEFDLPIDYSSRHPYFDFAMNDAALIFHFDGLAPGDNDVVPNLREDAIELQLLSSRAKNAFQTAWTIAFSKVKMGFK